ncbi:MAG: stage II sporulation protein R [Acutalibacteraceae bacterium]|nr:stage II sporulation protein R [Acutalibacteraceae bacterium]
MFIKKYVLKNISVVLSCVVIFACLISMSKFNVSCDKIKDDVLRLHIRANSDNDFDQELKLKVRDRILNDTGDMFYKIMTYEEAVEKTENALPTIIESAKDEIKNQGYDYDVKASLGYSYFSTRHYDGYTLPAGNYMALNVEIGEGKGQNWWCVMFPSICLSSATKLDDKLDKDEIEVITDYSGYKVQFKLIELYENIKQKLKAES